MPVQEIGTSLKELLNWSLIRVSRRASNFHEYFEASSDVWELPCTIVRERKQREFAPSSAMLRDLIARPGFRQRTPDTQNRVHKTLRLMDSMGAWSDEIAASLAHDAGPDSEAGGQCSTVCQRQQRQR